MCLSTTFEAVQLTPLRQQVRLQLTSLNIMTNLETCELKQKLKHKKEIEVNTYL